MKSIFLTFSILFTLNVMSQNDETSTTIVTSGTGNTEDVARNNALRSAIELAYTTYVSSKTEILNDELVKDEIIAVASGNIVDYTILEKSNMNNIFHNTISVTVSINKLVSYSESKGVTVEFSGSIFGAEMKQQRINEKAEELSILNISTVFDELMSKSFDYKLDVSEPVSANNLYSITYNVTSTCNENYKTAIAYFLSNLKAVSMNEQEVLKYHNTKKKVFRIGIIENNSTEFKSYYATLTSTGEYNRPIVIRNEMGEVKHKGVIEYIYLRNYNSYTILLNLFIKANRYPYLFRIENNIEVLYPNLSKWKIPNLSTKISFPLISIGSGNGVSNFSTRYCSTTGVYEDLFKKFDTLNDNRFLEKDLYFKGVLSDYSDYLNKYKDYNLTYSHSPLENYTGMPQTSPPHKFLPYANTDGTILEALLISNTLNYTFTSSFNKEYTIEEIEKLTKIDVVPLIK